MPRRVLAPAALAFVVLLVASGCADDTAPAARVGDVTITQDELMDEVAEWEGNAATGRATLLRASPHAFNTAPVSEILTERVILDVLSAEFDARGLELTEEMRQGAFTALGIDPSQEEALLGGFSDEYRDAYLDAYAKGVALQSELGQEEFFAVVDGIGDEVEIDPRYGEWDQTQVAVVPPTPPGGAAADPATEP